MTAPVRWGILGCADIATKFCHGVSVLEQSSPAAATIVAVASRNMDKAKAYAKQHAPNAKAYSSYDDLLNDPDVDAVYIPLPTGLRKEWVIKAAEKGKHVDCEKPIGRDYAESVEIVKACQKAGVQFMDNTMFMHHPRLAKMEETLRSGELGRVKHCVSSFTIPFGNDPAWASNIRMQKNTEPLGALGDLGWYNIRISLWAFAWEMPEAVSAQILEATDEGVPLTMQCLLKYSGGRSASFDCSFKCSLRQWAEVVGEKKTMAWDDLVVNQEKESRFTVGECSIADRAIFFPKASAEYRIDECIQHANLIENMSKMIRGGNLDPSWPKKSLQTQSVMMACLASGEKQGAWVQPEKVDA